ncbi:MAG: amino acid ABC transporter ATP-binding/permease protein [Candidatus Ornithomonoglobus sp.]
MKKRRNAVKIMAGLVGLIKPLLHFMIFAVLLGVTGFLCAIFIPVLGSVGILSAVGFDMDLSIKSVFICLITFGILRGILRYGEQACNHYIAFRILAVIRDKVFTALRKLCPARLEGRDKGNLISLITSDVELLEVFYAHTISPIIIAVAVSVIMITFICRISITSGIISALAYVTVGAVIPVINSRHVSGCGMEYRTISGELNAVFLDSLRGLRELIQYDRTEMKRVEIEEKTHQLGEIHKALKRREISSRNLTDIAVFAFNLIMLFTQGYLYTTGAVAFPEAVICVIALMSSYGPVIALSNLSNSLAQTLASGERVLSLLEEEPQTKEIKNGKNINIDNISCRRLSFSYGGEKILNNVNIDAEKHSITGIYGKSGCGKSTLLKLIMRFWDRDSGDLKLSGTDIDKINTDCLRKNESYCTQETYLFNDTIGNNIKIAKPGASYSEVINAAKAASIHDFIITLPLGYNTQIGELGDRLSGGEKQRIGIARAFLSGAPVMLLDEPTSNLDSLNEAVILKSLREAKDKTIILVSHRKSTLGIADRIYSLENKERLS